MRNSQIHLFSYCKLKQPSSWLLVPSSASTLMDIWSQFLQQTQSTINGSGKVENYVTSALSIYLSLYLERERERERVTTPLDLQDIMLVLLLFVFFCWYRNHKTMLIRSMAFAWIILTILQLTLDSRIAKCICSIFTIICYYLFLETCLLWPHIWH